MKLPDISVEVWKNNYCGPGEKSLVDTWHRQAKVCSDIENEAIRENIYNDFMWIFKNIPHQFVSKRSSVLKICCFKKSILNF